MQYISVTEAIQLDGLRLVLTEGVPGPWGESAKNIFHVKRLTYHPVGQSAGMDNAELYSWTGQSSAPVAIYDDERPRANSLEILYLAERLQPKPKLIPDDANERVLMFGLIREIIGENGFGWCRRLAMLEGIVGVADFEEIAQRLVRKYGYSEAELHLAKNRIKQILCLLSERLLIQRDLGSAYFIGNSLTALDIYWASFSNMLKPLPQELNPMSKGNRAGYTLQDPQLLEVAAPLLIEHRDFIYKSYLKLPMDF